MASTQEINRERIQATERLIRPHIRWTPVLEADAADFGLEAFPLILKLELFQHTGSFKTRGAFANLLTLNVPAAGVVAASGGNHGAAVAYAARKLGMPARIYVPGVSSSEKQARIRGYGAELVVIGECYAEALEASERWAEESGAMQVHAYNQPETLLGQGTVGLEFESQAPQLDTLLVAVGGGGLIGGIAAWYSEGAASERIRLLGVEPEAAPTLANALLVGHPVESPAGGIAADSLAPKSVGELMFPIAQANVERVILVPDESIQQAQDLLWERTRIVTEPGGAAAFAALVSGGYRPQAGERVGVLVCGGNTSAVNFKRV